MNHDTHQAKATVWAAFARGELDEDLATRLLLQIDRQAHAAGRAGSVRPERTRDWQRHHPLRQAA